VYYFRFVAQILFTRLHINGAFIKIKIPQISWAEHELTFCLHSAWLLFLLRPLDSRNIPLLTLWNELLEFHFFIVEHYSKTFCFLSRMRICNPNICIGCMRSSRSLFPPGRGAPRCTPRPYAHAHKQMHIDLAAIPFQRVGNGDVTTHLHCKKKMKRCAMYLQHAQL